MINFYYKVRQLLLSVTVIAKRDVTNVALCGMKSINLTKKSIKILGVHISYNKEIQDDWNFA